MTLREQQEDPALQFPSITLLWSSIIMPSDTQTSQFHVAIIGGGLGGLALAIGLQQRNVAFHIYEAAAQFSEIGAGVVFGSNAVRALGLIHPALISAYRKLATPNPPGTWLTYRYGMQFQNKSLNQNGNTSGEETRDAGQVFWKQRDHAESGYVHRARLLDEMIKLIPDGTASFNKRLERVEQMLDHRVMLFFEDGTTAIADAVVGCDGIKSRTRSFVCGQSVQPVYSGQYAYRQLFPLDVAIAALGHERAKSMTLECGYGGYIVHYPLEDGEFMNITAVVNDKRPKWDDDDWLVPTSYEAMLEDWKGWDARVLNLMSRISQPQRRALFDLKHDRPYARSRVCLLGDSAHAATPHNGAGAGMAMEDAYVLSGLLADVENVEDLALAFKAYDSVRRPRSQQLIDVSRLSGLTKCLMCPGVGDDSEKFKKHIDSTYAWIWEIDLEGHLDKAKAIMQEYQTKS